MTEALSSEVLSILQDREQAIEKLLTIPTKDTRVVPFRLWHNQRAFIRRLAAPNRPRRRVHLKARQVGESSIIVANNAIDVMTTANLTVLVICQDKPTRELFRNHYKQHLADFQAAGIAPTVGTDNADMLEFPLLNSRVLFETAEGEGVGRAWTINRGHFTEVAHWPHPVTTLTGALQSIPFDTGEVDIESTPNGAGGVFHNVVKAALAAKESAIGGYWELFFFPWWETDEYISEDDSPMGDLTPQELYLIQEKGLTYAHIHWRRMKEAELALTQKPVDQEYPEDPITCFYGGLRSPFKKEVIQRLVRDCRPPIAKGIPTDGGPRKYSKALWIWKEPRGNRQYAVGGDISEGSGQDFMAAVVIDCKTLEVVAAYYDDHTDPVAAAQVLVDIGHYYNDAMLVPETYPGVGYATGKYLENEFRYPNLFYMVDPRRPEYIGDVGWRTDTRTRPMIQSALLDHIPSGSVLLWDERGVQEIASLVWTERGEEGKRVRLEAIAGENDDYCIALGIVLVAVDLQPPQVERPEPGRVRKQTL